jgi:vitamin B12/bleomycin/antimicrobial peptide transport system ATP-binding/permease protein
MVVASPPAVAATDRRRLSARFWRATFQAWRKNRTRAVGLAVLLVAIVLLQLLVQVLLNVWNRNFFDAVEQRNAHALLLQIQLFFPLAAASIFLAAISVWGRMTAQRGWREALSRRVIEKWLTRNRLHHLDHLIKGSENPEYRIAVDVRVATDAPVDMALAVLSSVLTALTFFSVLWRIGGSIQFVLWGWSVTIPGYLVIGVIVYSGAMSTLMILFGRHLASIIERMNQGEAEFRGAIEAFRERTEQSELPPSGGAKRDSLWVRLQAVLLWWRELAWQLVRTTIVSHGNFLFAPVFAWMLCVPKYLTGAMSLGELTQSAAAFVVVQSGFNWLVDNYQRLAEWRSSAYRVATLLAALDEIEAKEKITAPEIGPGSGHG